MIYACAGQNSIAAKKGRSFCRISARVSVAAFLAENLIVGERIAGDEAAAADRAVFGANGRAWGAFGHGDATGAGALLAGCNLGHRNKTPAALGGDEVNIPVNLNQFLLKSW